MTMTALHILTGTEDFRARPVVRRIGVRDLKDALARGIDDFMAMPSHAAFLCLIYPLIGLLLGWLTFGRELFSLLYPLVSGFALLGPFAAIVLYELSRQRERGLAVDLTSAFGVLDSPSLGAIAVLGLLLLTIFLIWLAVAQAIYVATFGDAPMPSITTFLERVFTTPEGWWLIVVGNAAGFLFALLVLSISVISFPLLLDRDVGAVEGVRTSLRAVREHNFPQRFLPVKFASHGERSREAARIATRSIGVRSSDSPARAEILHRLQRPRVLPPKTRMRRPSDS
jgi:uncharacterized membrane protein